MWNSWLGNSLLYLLPFLRTVHKFQFLLSGFPLHIEEITLFNILCVYFWITEKMLPDRETKGDHARQDETRLAVAFWNTGVLCVEKNNINEGESPFSPVPSLNRVNCLVLLFRVTGGTVQPVSPSRAQPLWIVSLSLLSCDLFSVSAVSVAS